MVLLALTLHAQQTTRVLPPQSETSPQPTGTGAITGEVLDGATDRPAAGAIVTLEERLPGSPRPVRSYAQVATPTGRFAFCRPSGLWTRHFLTAAKSGYLDGGYGRNDPPRGPSAPVVLNVGQWLRDVRVTLAHPGSISGTVLDERGEPIVGAHVRLLPEVLISGRTQWLAGAVASTDDRGAYRIPGLGPGRYVVSVPSVQATLPASATIERGGAWAGTSTADSIAANAAAQAEKLVVDVGGGQQLVVGRYVVPPPPTPDGQRTAYPVAFYPNVASPADATPVELRASEDRSGIDFHLQPARTARVSGQVQGPPEAIGNLRLRLIPVGLEELGQGSEAATTVTLADGRFTFLDVPSGSYVLDARHTLLSSSHLVHVHERQCCLTALPAPVAFSARSASSFGIRAAPPGVEYSMLRDAADVSYWGQARVDVSGHDIDTLVLPLRRPATLSGRIARAPDASPSSNWVVPVLEPADGRPSLGALTSSPFDRRENPTVFTIEGLLAGEYFLRLAMGSAAIESITWEGKDYTERPFDASAGVDIAGVVMTVTNASSSISGVVTDGRMALTSGAAVIAFPVEKERWSDYGFNPTGLKSVLTTSDGRYQVDGLPVGDDYLLAVPASQQVAWLDPAFLASHAARASRARVDRSDAKLSGLALSLVK